MVPPKTALSREKKEIFLRGGGNDFQEKYPPA